MEENDRLAIRYFCATRQLEASVFFSFQYSRAGALGHAESFVGAAAIDQNDLVVAWFMRKGRQKCGQTWLFIESGDNDRNHFMPTGVRARRSAISTRYFEAIDFAVATPLPSNLTASVLQFSP